MKTIESKSIFNIFSRKHHHLKKIEKKEVTIDYREKNSLVHVYLKKRGFEIEFKELKIGDYIVKGTVIERKTIPDFINSMINHHLLNQIEELKQHKNKLIIIEGFSEQNLYGQKDERVNAYAIRGFLLSIVLKHQIPIIFSENSEDTAKFIDILSSKKEKELNLNAKKRIFSGKEQLQFIIESFPGIGPKKAKKLLEKFGNIQNIILASEEDLKEILGKRAKEIRNIIESKY